MTLEKLKIINFYYGYNCNLSCDGCFSGCDLIGEKYDPSFDSVLKSVEDLSKYAAGANEMITLIGGEPLLYWEDRIVPLTKCIRKFFPDSNINITTNALLISKYKDQIFDLLLEVDNIRLSITDHLVEVDKEDNFSKKYYKNLDTFLADPRLNKIHDEHYDIPDTNIDIYVHKFETFKAQFLMIGGKVKPFKTNNPAQSKARGCTGDCATVIDSKLYKCPRLASLTRILHKTNQLDDPEWQKYLKYQPVDLSSNNSYDSMREFFETQNKPISVCDMCPDKHIINITALPHKKENIIRKAIS